MPVLLAKVFDPEKHDPTGWWMSEKLDGMRALWTGAKFITRTGKPINAPDWFIRPLRLHPQIQLDGELFVGRGQFNTTVSICRKKMPIDAEWRNIRYMVFDAPAHNGPFEERLAWLRDELLHRNNVELIQHLRCKSMDHLIHHYNTLLGYGAEGVMLREPGSLYVRKRHGSLLKFKPEIDGVAFVTGVKPGEGKHKGRMGALYVQEVDCPPEVYRKSGATVIKFKVGTGFSDAEREQPWPEETMIRWRAQERTPSAP